MSKIDRDSVTREDVKQIVTEAVEELAVIIKSSFDNVNQQLERTREYIDASIKKSEEHTKRHFDVVAENIHADVAGANKDEISLIKQKQQVLEERVTAIGEKVGV